MLSISVKEGQTVEVDSVVGSIDETVSPEQSKKESKNDKQQLPSKQEAKKYEAEQEASPSTAERTSPAARHLLAEHNLQAKDVQGSGPGGVITKQDVMAFIGDGTAEAEEEAASEETPSDAGSVEPSTPPQVNRTSDRETRKALSTIRLRIADRLLASQQSTATLTTFNEADLSAVMQLRARYKDRFREKHDVGLGYMSFFVKASVEALRTFPLVNARLEGTEVVYHNYYDVGVAVSTDRGLMVPIVRNAESMSFAEVEKTINNLPIKARDAKITVKDLQGGTINITNGGVFGSLLSTPILNTPQTAILGMHTIQKRPVVVDDEIAIRPMMYLALSYDHRLIDGREAVQFLIRIKECIEDPERMLLDI